MTERNRDSRKVEAWAIRLGPCTTLLREDEGQAIELAKRTGGSLRRIMATRDRLECERALEARRHNRGTGT